MEVTFETCSIGSTSIHSMYMAMPQIVLLKYLVTAVDFVLVLNSVLSCLTSGIYITVASS